MPAGWLFIPILALWFPVGFVPIVDGAYDTSQLHYGVGRLEHTTWGRTDGGRTVIAGHTPGAFSELHTLTVGDRVIIVMNDGPIVEFQVVELYWTTPDDTRLLTEPPAEYELALITCSSDERHRLIVRAERVK